jgi:branched-chain amino acid transport system ATP-binding protein
MSAAETLLDIHGLAVDGVERPALAGVDIEVRPGEIVALLGPNGGGKTTLIRSIIGLATPSSGDIAFCGASLSGLPVESRAQLGIAYVPEGRRVFPGLNVHDNLVVACDADPDERKRRVAEIVELFRPLKEQLHVPAWTMSGGQQQMIAIGRALISDPLLLMLDEPSLGLAPTVLRDLLARLGGIASRGTAILLAEQNAAAALAVADRAYFLDRGQVIATGTAAEFLADTGALSAALGL